jgi:hypothetical protein
VFMDRGEIVESGPPRRMFEAPETDRLKLFLSQIYGTIEGASVDRAVANLAVTRGAWAMTSGSAGSLNAVAWAGDVVLAEGEPVDTSRAIA